MESASKELAISAPDGAGATRPLISVIIPVRNEQAIIPELERRVLGVADAMDYDFEFITIDNDSTDDSGRLLKELCIRDPRWKYIKFSRNFTAEISVTAGYHFAEGDAIIVLYSDLQDPPELIPELVAKWREGYDVVFGVQTARRGDPMWRNVLARLFYRLVGWLSDVRIPRNAGDFRLISKQVRDGLEQCQEYNRYTRGLIAWLGFRQIGIPYERQPRQKGKSQTSLLADLHFAVNAITSFSLQPLRFFSIAGITILVLSFIAAIIYAILGILGSPPRGVTTIIVLLFVVIGINSLGIGVLGEYLGRAYAETKRRPLYIVEEAVNLRPTARPRSPKTNHSGSEPRG